MVRKKRPNIFDKFAQLKGAKFISIHGYRNQYGEIANHVLNVNVNIENAKRQDLKTLQSITEAELAEMASKHGIPMQTAKLALSELINSAERNLTQDNRTVASTAQTETYISLGKNLRLRKETFELYVCGFANPDQKVVIVEGVYPKRNKQPRTIIKDEIRKRLKMHRFKNFNLGKADLLKVTGDTITIY